MATDILTTQQYLNTKAGTVGLTKQQCLQYLAGSVAIGMTAQDAANNYAGTTGLTIQGALKTQVGDSVAGDDNIVFPLQEVARRL